MEKWVISGLGRGKYKVYLKYLLMPESTGSVQKLMRCQKDIGAILKELTLVKFGSIGTLRRIVKIINNNTSKQINESIETLKIIIVE